MFSWITKQAVRHTDGFIVKSGGRFSMVYVEGGKVMTIGVDNGRLPNGKYCIEIGPGSFLHWDGEQVILPSSEQSRIEKNFVEAIRFQGLEVVKMAI